MYVLPLNCVGVLRSNYLSVAPMEYTVVENANV